MKSRISLLLLAALSAAAQTIIEPRIVSETLPSGGLMQIKLDLTSPHPISTSGADFSFDLSFESMEGVAILTPSGDGYGVAYISNQRFKANLVSPQFSLGTQLDYPFLMVAAKIRAGLAPGTVVPINWGPTTIFKDSTGAPYSLPAPQNGTLTIGGSVSITNIVPGGGLIPAGTTVRILGTGFSPDTDVFINEAAATNIRYVSPTEIDFTMSAARDLTGTRFRVRNKDNSDDTYYSYLRAVAFGASNRATVNGLHPLYQAQTYTSAGIAVPATGLNGYVALALRNANPGNATVQLDLVSAAGASLGTANFILPSGGQYVRTVQELFGNAPSGAVVKVASDAAINALGMLGDDTSGLVTAFLPGPAPVINPASPTLTLTPNALSFTAAGTQTVAVGSTGAALSYGASSNAAWLTVLPAAGTTPGNLSVTANPAGLAPGNYTGTITVTPAGAAVQTVSVSLTVPGPPSLVSASKNQQTVTIVARDPNGAADINRVYFLVNPTTNIAGNTCHGFYDRPQNAVSLYNDTLSGLVPGGANSQCSVQLVSAVASGTDLTLTLNIQLLNFYDSRQQNLYLWITDAEALGTGWLPSVSWPAQNPLPPTLVTASRSAQSVTLIARDPNGAADIARIYFLFNPTPTVPQFTCHGFYDRASNQVYLYNDSLTSLSSLQNSQCSIQPPTVTASGTDLTLTLPVTLQPTFTNTNAYFWIVDSAGLGTGWVNATPAPPTVRPATLTAQTVTITTSDPNGATDINRAYFLINPTPTVPQNTCHGFYDRPTNSVYLYNDTLTSLATLQNSQCSIQGFTATSTGNDLTLILQLTLQPAYASAGQKLYVWAVDSANLGTGWVQAAAYSAAAPQPPVLLSATRTAPNYTFIARDPNGAADINRIYFVLNATPTVTTNGCHGFYDRPSNQVYLYNDSLTALVSPLQNSQCAVQAFSATASGTDLTLNMTITQQVAPQNAYVWIVDSTGLGTGWQ